MNEIVLLVAVFIFSALWFLSRMFFATPATASDFKPKDKAVQLSPGALALQQKLNLPNNTSTITISAENVHIDLNIPLFLI